MIINNVRVESVAVFRRLYKTTYGNLSEGQKYTFENSAWEVSAKKDGSLWFPNRRGPDENIRRTTKNTVVWAEKDD